MLYDKKGSRIDDGFRSSYSAHARCYVRKCVVCGDEFKSCINERSKYCSARCANDAYIAWRRDKIAKKRNTADKCTVCGIEITQNGAKISLYCSNSCKQKAYRARIKHKAL